MRRASVPQSLVVAAAVAALLLLVAPRAAVAQPNPRAEAEMYYRAGESAYKGGKYLAAAQAFEQAYELLPVPAIAFSTAQAYRLLYVGDRQAAYVKRAVELYRLYIQQVKEGGRVPDATASLAELEPVLERLAAAGQSMAMPVVAARTQLMITSQVAGARAEVGGSAGPLPLIVDVKPGEYLVKAEADGYFPAELKANAVEGQFLVYEVTPQPRPAILDLRAEDGARVEVDGRPVGEAPLARPVEVPAGRHYVTVTRRGRLPYARELQAGRGETVRVDVALRTTAQRKAVPWVWGGAGLLALAAGGTGLWALHEQGKALELDERRQATFITSPELEAYRDHRADRDTAVRWTWGLAGAGVLTAVVGTLMYAFDRPVADGPPPALGGTPEDAAPVVEPFGTEGGAGVSLRGRW